MPKTRLTELSVKNADTTETQYVLWDASLPNFGVRVSPGGTKNFIAMLGAQRERVSIGRFPIISLVDARTKAKELMAARVLGEPQWKTIKFCEAFEIFKEQHCARKRPSTTRGYVRILTVHFLPKLREDRLSEISTEALARITDKMVDTPSEQGHAQAVARIFFRWAVRRRFIKIVPPTVVGRALAPRQRIVAGDRGRAAVGIIGARRPIVVGIGGLHRVAKGT